MLLCNIYFIFWCHGWLLCGVEANGVLWMLCVIFHFVYSDFNRLLFATLFPSPIQFIILWWFLSDFLYKRCQYMCTRESKPTVRFKGNMTTMMWNVKSISRWSWKKESAQQRGCQIRKRERGGGRKKRQPHVKIQYVWAFCGYSCLSKCIANISNLSMARQLL